MKKVITFIIGLYFFSTVKAQTLQTVTTSGNSSTNALRLTGEANIGASGSPELVLGFLSTIRTNDTRAFIGWKGDAATNTTTNGLAGALLLQPRTNFSDMSVDFATGYLTPQLRMRIAGNGNVSIGDNNLAPASRLLIKGSGATNATTSLLIQNSAATELFRVLDNGNVGIGLTNPAVKLDVAGLGANNIDFQTTGRMAIRGSSPGVSFTDGVTEKSFIGWVGSGIPSQVFGIYTPTADVRGGWNTLNVMSNGSIALGAQATNINAKLDVTGNIFANGKVLIGLSGLTQTDYASKVGTYLLAVNGDAIFKRAVVKNYANWADFVFEEKYSLQPLEELERFIKSNKHLPDVPTAAEVEKDGIDLGSNQTILLQKIEELTLYTIEQNKKNTHQQEQINQLLQEVKSLKSQQNK